MIDIVALGEPLAEFNQLEPGGPFHLGFGGDTSNCAIAAARAGASAGFMTRIGDDMFGDSLMALWAREGVDASRVTKADAPTGIYFITHGPAGHDFTYVRKGSAASLMEPADLDDDYVRAARVLHVSAISQAISASARATVDRAIAAAGCLSYDTNLRLKLWTLDEARAVIFDTIPQADILRPSFDDARLLLGLDDPDAIADAFLSMGAGVVIMTLGPDGALVASAGERHHIPGRKVAFIDASGAGDAFSGAFFAEYLARGSLLEAARFANAAAALSVTRFGAISSYATRAEITRALGTS